MEIMTNKNEVFISLVQNRKIDKNTVIQNQSCPGTGILRLPVKLYANTKKVIGFTLNLEKINFKNDFLRKGS